MRMTRRSMVGLLPAVLGGCALRPRAAEVRYRVTVEVLDGGQPRTGSAVWSHLLAKPAVALVSAYDGKFHGEAVAVDLSGGRTLFALLRDARGGNAMPLLPERLFGDIGRSARGEKKRFGADRLADVRDIATRDGAVASLDWREHPGWAPMLVTFRDIADPTTVEKVDPDAPAAVLGPGVALTGIRVAITRDPVSTGIARRLPWLGRYPEPSLDPAYRGSTNPTLPQLLRHGDFLRGSDA